MAGIDAPFPSSKWFEQLVARATSDAAAMERLGIAELRFGMEIVVPDGATQFFGLVLDGYDIEAVGPLSEHEFRPEVVMSGLVEAWDEMIGWIQANGPADSAHSLNGLTIAGVPFEARSEDAMGSDKFYRYMGTLQAIFDAAGEPVSVGAGR